MFKLLAKIFGSSNERILVNYKAKLPLIHQFYQEFKKFKEDDFETKTNEFRNRLKNGEKLILKMLILKGILFHL